MCRVLNRTNGARKRAHRAAQDQAYEEYKEEFAAAQATASTKFCYAVSPGSSALDQTMFQQLPPHLTAQLLVTNFPIGKGFEYTLEHTKPNARPQLEPLTGPGGPVPDCGPDDHAMMERNAKVRGVLLKPPKHLYKRKLAQRKRQAPSTAESSMGKGGKAQQREFQPLERPSSVQNQQRAKFFADVWLAQEARIVQARLLELSGAAHSGAGACLVGASLEHCCAIGGSLSTKDFVFPLLQSMRQRDLSMLDDEKWRGELEEALVVTIVTTIPPERSEEEPVAVAEAKHEEQATVFATEYVDMIRGGHRRPAR